MTTRVDPVRPPYPPDIAERLDAMMPPGVPPILLFRTFVRNLPMTAAMSGWGSYELSKRLSLSMRDREIIIDRTCARCRCEYEWGVHVAFFAERAGLSSAADHLPHAWQRGRSVLDRRAGPAAHRGGRCPARLR